MFKFKKKTLIPLVIFFSAFFLISFLSTAITSLFFNTLKQPFSLIQLIRRELGALIFYHHNYIQNERLRNENNFLQNKLNAQQEITNENKRLKDLLSFKHKSQLKVIAAKVVARSPDSWSSSIIIDKGRRNGLRSAMPVVNYLGLLGRVLEVSESTSKVILINDPNFAVSAIDQRSRQEGLVCGALGVNLIMKYLPENPDMNNSDVVVTSGLSPNFPKGLIIGKVVKINKEFSGLNRYAIIQPAVNMSNIEEVLVVVE